MPANQDGFSKFTGVIQDWWGFAAFVLAAGGGMWIGRQRDKWEISNLKEDMKDMKKELQAMAKAEHARDVQSGQINATLTAIADNQKNILQAVHELQRGKADK